MNGSLLFAQIKQTQSQINAFELARSRTWNLLIRSQTRYPLRQ